MAKVVRWRDWRGALGAYGFAPRLETPVAALLPLTEAGVVILLVLGPARAGAALSLALLSGFSLAVLQARSRVGDRVPCGCFGRTEERDWRLILLRNSLLAAFAAILLLAGDRSGILNRAASITAGDLIPALLVMAGLALILWLAAQNLSASTRGSGTRGGSL